MENERSHDGDDELQHKFRILEQDWDSYNKQSNGPGLRRRRSYEDDVKSRANMLQLLDTSPRSLITDLQHEPKESFPWEESEEEWRVRRNDLAVLEIMGERKEAIEKGRFKGRSLLEAMENEIHDHNSGTCSSVLIQGSEVRSLLCSCSSSSDSASDKSANLCFPSSSSCSSSSCVTVEKKKKKKMETEDDQLVVEQKISDVCLDECRDAGKGMLIMAWFTIFLMMFALGIILLKSFEVGYGNEEDLHIMLKPT